MTRALTMEIANKDLWHDRITTDPQIMSGRPCIRGMRITVSLVLSLVASEMKTSEILEAYPYLEAEDIKASLQYAAFLAQSQRSPFSGVSA